MQVHGSCAARENAGVLLLGPPGSGKSDLVLRLLDRGFILVADDRVDITLGKASPPPALAGLLEVRGLGLLRLPFLARAPLALAVDLASPPMRLPGHEVHSPTGLPLIHLSAFHASAPQRIEWALDCVLGHRRLAAGAFGAA